MTVRSRALIRPVVASALAAGMLVAASGCNSTSVLSLEVGQCVDSEREAEESVSSVPVVDCAEPHTEEIFALPQLPDGDYPGDAAVGEQAEELCVQAFEDYVGLPVTESELGVNTLTPSADTWEQEDDREIVCLVAAADGTPTTGSVRGANR